MKLKVFILAFCIPISLYTSGSIQTYQIHGKIGKSMNDKQVMLFKMLGDSVISVDTTLIKNGSFFFQGSGQFVDVAVLTTGNYPEKVYSTEVVLENGNIIVNMDSLKVHGPLNDLYNSYILKFDDLGEEINALWIKDKRQASVNGSDYLNKIKERHDLVFNTIKTNISNAIGYRVLDLQLENLEVNELRIIDSIFPADLKPVELIKNEIIDKLEMRKNFEAQTSSVGSQYQDFELYTTDNKKRMLSEFVGKSRYVYIDFWASWCGPCIADFPNLQIVYEKYKSKGFEIVGVSVDEDSELWKKAVTRVKTPWVQLSVLKDARSQLKKAYNVVTIPQGFLIDQNGTIVALFNRAEDLGNRLSKLLDK